MRIRNKILAGLLLTATTATAQEPMLFQDSHSPLETDWQQMGVRPELSQRDALLDNPALLFGEMDDRRRFFNDNPLTEHRTYPIAVALSGATGRMRGDFQPAEGNSFDDVSVAANGHIRGQRSLLFGKAAFTTGTHRNIGWNILRSPETYWPYIVADSTGGNMGYETYNLKVAYSFRLNKRIDLGLSGEYTGDFAYRKTDPRIEDITSWLTLKGGMAYALTGGDRLGLSLEYQLHRQHSEVKHFRSGQFAGFFMEYGFGMFDYIHSPIYNSMKNQQHQHSYGAAVQYLSASRRPLRLNARLAYGLDVMNSEENIYKLELYHATTNRLTANLSALWNNASWGAAFFANATIAQRKGRENIFERYVSSQVDGVDIYDYRKIGHNDRYTLNKATANAQAKLSHYFGRTTTVSLIAALDYFRREERYTENGYHITNALLTPHIGVEAQHASRLADARLTLRYGRRTSLQNKYNVAVDLDRHTEYQHAFSPYAYYSHEGDVVTIEAEASHTFPKLRMGLQAQLMFVSAQRLDNAIYDGTRYSESVPLTHKHTPCLAPDRHNQHWLRVTLFAEF